MKVCSQVSKPRDERMRMLVLCSMEGESRIKVYLVDRIDSVDNVYIVN